jgi:hypothetical protein
VSARYRNKLKTSTISIDWCQYNTILPIKVKISQAALKLTDIFKVNTKYKYIKYLVYMYLYICLYTIYININKMI